MAAKTTMYIDPDQKIQKLEYQLTALRNRLARVREKASALSHDRNCPEYLALHYEWQGEHVCDCGLDELLREVGHE